MCVPSICWTHPLSPELMADTYGHIADGFSGCESIASVLGHASLPSWSTLPRPVLPFGYPQSVNPRRSSVHSSPHHPTTSSPMGH